MEGKVKTLGQKFNDRGYTVAENGCWIWNGRIHPNGYGSVGRHLKAHRASYLLYKGEIPAGMDVCHTCDNPPCVNPDHLFLGTRKDNMQDCKVKGRIRSRGKPGEGNGSSKLSAETVIQILSEHKRKYGENKRLAKKFGIHHSTVSLIVHEKTWKHLKASEANHAHPH